MAAYYFDTNGNTAGFGPVLTGVWDTTTALWTTSSAGTTVPAAVLFTNVDSANFGVAGVTTTAGTVTIQDGVNVTLNAMSTANLAALHTIASVGSGSLTFSGTTPTVTVNSAGGLAISAPVAGTSLLKAGTGTLTLSGPTVSLTTLTPSIGTLEVSTATTQTVSSSINGNGIFNKTGVGVTTLTGGATTSATGAWGINGGTLEVTTNPVLATSGNITVGAGAALTSTVAITKPVIVSAGSTGSNFITTGGATQTISGTATINGDTTGSVTVNSGGTATLTGSTGVLTLNGTTNLLGTGVTSSGAHILGNSGGVSVVTVGAGRTFSVGDVDVSWATSGSRLAIYQQGNVTLTGGGTVRGVRFNPSTGYGYWALNGGTLDSGGGSFFSLGTSLSGSSLAVGGPSLMDVDGGTLRIRRMIFVGCSATGANAIHILSGTHTFSDSTDNDTFGFAGGSTLSTPVGGASTAQQRVTLEGSASLLCNLRFFMRSAAAAGLNQLNIKDNASVKFSRAGLLDGAAPKEINLINGGTYIQTVGAFSISGGPAALRLYGTGNKISCDVSTSTDINLPIVSATGNGVTSIELDSGGAGYVAPPVIVLSGGGGTGASARAVLTNGVITDIVVTCPGYGYTSAPTVNLFGATLASGCCTTELVVRQVNIGPNVSSGLTKLGTGTLTLSGVNTFTGDLQVSEGTLLVTGTFGDATCNVIVNAGATATLNKSAAVTIANLSGAGTFTKVTGTGTLSVTGTTVSVGTLTHSAGTLQFAPTGTQTVSSSITGAGAVAKSDVGVTILNGNNTYTGGTSVSGGTLVIPTTTAIGSGSLTVTGGSVELRGGKTITNTWASLQGTGDANKGAIYNGVADNTLSGNITLAGATRLGAAAGTVLTLSGSVLAGTNPITKVGAGQLCVRGSGSTGTGAVTISEGTLYLNTTSATALPSGLLTVGNGGTLAGYLASYASVNLPGSITLEAGSALRFGAPA